MPTSGQYIDGEDGLSPSVRQALDDWVPSGPSPAFRASLKNNFVGGAAPASGASPSEAVPAAPRSASRPVRHERGRRRSVPQPARQMSTQLRLLSGAGLLAAAAALFLIFGQEGSPALQADPSGGGDPQVAQGSGSDPTETIGTTSPWTLDLGRQDLSEVLAAVLIDGAAMDSIAALEESLATAERIEVGDLGDRVGDPDHGHLGGGIRIRHGDEYVLDLATGTSLELRYVEPEEAGSSAASGGAGDLAETVLFASAGAVRVATGPGFDRSRPLVLRTPHVRTEVVGTIYGVDIGEGYTCVCCLEGSVIADPCHGRFPALTVPPLGTRVLLASGERPKASPLFGGHRGPLDALEGYWL